MSTSDAHALGLAEDSTFKIDEIVSENMFHVSNLLQSTVM